MNIKTLCCAVAFMLCCAAPAAFATQNLNGYGVDMTMSQNGQWVNGTFEDLAPESPDEDWKNNMLMFNETYYSDKSIGISSVKDFIYITDEDAHNGENSLKFDTVNMQHDTTLNRYLLFMDMVRMSGHDVKLYVEGYIKVEGDISKVYKNTSDPFSSPVHLRLDKYGNPYKNAAIGLNKETEPDENGWYKISSVTDWTTSGASNIWYGIGVFPERNDLYTTVYFDDMVIYELPKAIELSVPESCYAVYEKIMLDDLTLSGVDYSNKTDAFANYDRVNYSVVSGNAVIEDGAVVYDPSKGESDQIVVQAEYLGLTATAGFTFGSAVSVGNIELNENKVSAKLQNNTSKKQNVSLILAIYSEDGVLKQLTQKKAQFSANQTGVLISDELDLQSIENCRIVAYVWNSIGGFVAYTDSVEVKQGE